MLRFLTSGESHGPQLTVIIDGFPAGLQVNIEEINFQLARRQKGYGRGGRMKIENDRVEVVSGMRGGKTLGSPITLIVRNLDWENWKDVMDPVNAADDSSTGAATRPRPGHADLAGAIKYSHHDLRNVLERASARETAARVAAGALARQFLERFGVRFASHVVQIGSAKVTGHTDASDLDKLIEKAEKSRVRCADSDVENLMVEKIKAAGKDGDSLGGLVEIIVRGVPAGLGGFSQWDQRLDSRLAASGMSIPSVKGVEIGQGFGLAGMKGSEAQDEILYEQGSKPTGKDFYRASNKAGGIEGGISNGEDIVFKLAVKPISTLGKPMRSVDIVTKKPASAIVERADICVVPAVAVIGEAVAALALAGAFVAKFGGDNLTEIEAHFEAFMKKSF